MNVLKAILSLGAAAMVGACSAGIYAENILTDIKNGMSEEVEPEWIIKTGATPPAGYERDRWADPDSGCIYTRSLIEGATVWTTLGKPENVDEGLCPAYFVVDYTKDKTKWDSVRKFMKVGEHQPRERPEKGSPN